MSQETILLSKIKASIKVLVEEHQEVLEVLNTKVEEISSLKNELEKAKTQVKELEDRNLKLKMASSLSGSADKNTATKLKINEMVREIDKCIALLNNK